MIKMKNLAFEQGSVQICVPIAEKRVINILETAKQAVAQKADLVELRIDCIEQFQDAAHIKEILAHLVKVTGEMPILCTIRTDREGGEAKIDDAEYERLACFLCEQEETSAIDVEILPRPETAKRVIDYAHVKHLPVIGSNHDFQKTPDEAEILSRLLQMNHFGTDIAKIAYMPLEEEDLYTIRRAGERFRKQCPDVPTILIGMGEIGVETRTQAKEYGSVLTFATTGKASAPGQIPVEELRRRMK